MLLEISGEITPKRMKGWSQSKNNRNDAGAETPVLWPPHAKSWLIGKDFWCWEGVGAGGEGDDRGWDGWMASQTQWTWVWVNSGSWWWTGRPGILRFMGSQRVGHDWATELNWTELNTLLSATHKSSNFSTSLPECNLKTHNSVMGKPLSMFGTTWICVNLLFHL